MPWPCFLYNCLLIHFTALHFTLLCFTLHYVFRSIGALHSFRLKLCRVKYIVHCCSTVHCTALYCTALHCTALYSTALHTVLPSYCDPCLAELYSVPLAGQDDQLLHPHHAPPHLLPAGAAVHCNTEQCWLVLGSALQCMQGCPIEQPNICLSLQRELGGEGELIKWSCDKRNQLTRE